MMYDGKMLVTGILGNRFKAGDTACFKAPSWHESS
jgi:hypothetical protein